MTHHVAPEDVFFGTQRTMMCIFHSMNIYVALSVRGPEIGERWESVPSQLEILAATFDKPAEIS